MRNTLYTEQKHQHLSNWLDPDKESPETYQRRLVNLWYQDLKADKDLLDAVVGIKPPATYQIKRIENSDEDFYTIEETVTLSEAVPNYEKALEITQKLRETESTPLIPRNALPSYLRVIPSMPSSGGKYNVIFLWDQVPVDEQLEIEQVIDKTPWKLSFDVPRPKPPDPLDPTPRKLALLEGVLKRVLSHLESKQDTPPAKKKRVHLYRTDVPKSEWDCINELSLDRKREYLETRHTYISESFTSGPPQWSYSFQRKVRNYFETQQESAEAYPTEIDGNDHIRILGRVEKTAWESISPKNVQKQKPRKIPRGEPTSRVHLTVEGIGLKLQGNIKKGWMLKTDYCFLGARRIGKTLANLYRSHLICLTFKGTQIIIFRQMLKDLQQSLVGTFEKQILADLLDLREGVIRVSQEGINAPTAYHYQNKSHMKLEGMQNRSGVLSQEYDFGCGLQTEGMNEEDLSFIKTSLGRGSGDNTPYSGFMMLDANPDIDLGEDSWVLHTEIFERIRTDLTDNPDLYDPIKEEWTTKGSRYRESAKKQPGHIRAALFQGKWIKDKELVYGDEFDKTVHVLEELPQDTIITDKAVLSADWGTSDPTVFMLWVYRNFKWYFVRGFAKCGITEPGYITEKATEYIEWTQEKFSVPLEIAYPDPSNTMCNQALVNAGLTPRYPTGENKQILPGVRQVKSALKNRMIFFLADATDPPCPIMEGRNMKLTVFDEFNTYAFPKLKSFGEHRDRNPIKKHDHWMDPIRYFVIGEIRDGKDIATAHVTVITREQLELLPRPTLENLTPKSDEPRWKRHMRNKDDTGM